MLTSTRGVFSVEIPATTASRGRLSDVPEATLGITVTLNCTAQCKLIFQVDDNEPFELWSAHQRTLQAKIRFTKRPTGRIVIILNDNNGGEIDRLEATYELQPIHGCVHA